MAASARLRPTRRAISRRSLLRVPTASSCSARARASTSARLDRAGGRRPRVRASPTTSGRCRRRRRASRRCRWSDAPARRARVARRRPRTGGRRARCESLISASPKRSAMSAPMASTTPAASSPARAHLDHRALRAAEEEHAHHALGVRGLIVRPRRSTSHGYRDASCTSFVAARAWSPLALTMVKRPCRRVPSAHARPPRDLPVDGRVGCRTSIRSRDVAVKNEDRRRRQTRRVRSGARSAPDASARSARWTPPAPRSGARERRGDDDRAVPPARAADGDGEVALALALVLGQRRTRGAPRPCRANSCVSGSAARRRGPRGSVPGQVA